MASRLTYGASHGLIVRNGRPFASSARDPMADHTRRAGAARPGISGPVDGILIRAWMSPYRNETRSLVTSRAEVSVVGHFSYQALGSGFGNMNPAQVAVVCDFYAYERVEGMLIDAVVAMTNERAVDIFRDNEDQRASRLLKH